MKIFRLFTIAAAALMMVACSSEDTALNNSPAQQQGRKVHFTATIAAPGGNAGTRTEYTEVTEGDAAGTINVAWKAGDEIALIHNGTKDVVKVETVNENGSATITGTITVGTKGEAVTAYYPAAAIELNNDKNPVPAAAYTANLLAQDGTLSYIASNLDLRVGESTLAVDGDKATLSDNVKLASQIAIWKLSLQDDAETPAAIKATQVSVIKDGETPMTIASTAKLSTATSSVYLAMDAITNETLTIEATVGEGTYSYTNEDISLALGKYYQSTVSMAPQGYAANEYNYASWKSSDKKVIFTKKTAASVTAVTNSDTDVTWGDGWYTVSGNVTITGNVTLGSSTSLILQDGATLTINGQLNASNKDLYIYGQMEGTGKLNVTCNDDDAIKDDGGESLYIHGGEITATATGATHRGVYFGYIAMFGGKLTATAADCYAIRFESWGFVVYGGEVEGTSNATSGNYRGIQSESGTLKVFGGKVKGTGGAPSGKGFDCQVQSGTDNIKFYFSGDGATWDAGTCYGDKTQAPGYRYAKAEYTYPAPALNLTSPAVGQVIGDDGKNYDYASLPGGVTAVAKICYVSGSNGLALALADESSSKMTWNTAKSTCSGKTPTITGGTWKLATRAEWENMITAAGGFASLRDGFSSVGGTNMQSSDYYWSSTTTSDCAYVCNFSTGNWHDEYVDDYCTEYVRACLAF